MVMPDGGITALSGLQAHITQARASAAPPGDGIRHGVAFMPGGGCTLPGLRSYDLPLIYSPLLLKLPVLTASKSLRRSRKAGAARMDAG